jgi:hypothetical protein
LDDGLLPVEFVQFSKVKDCTISETLGRGYLKASVHQDRKGSNAITTLLGHRWKAVLIDGIRKVILEYGD